jgi:hypothetical protein
MMLMLDIGGGTTDIALWRGSEPLWRNSFRIAGGNFFTPYIANNPEILRHINFPLLADDLEGAKSLPSRDRMNFVELFVNKSDFNARFRQQFSRFSATPEGAGLRYCAFVALGGLMHYIGLTIKHLEQTEPDLGAQMTRLTVAMAGRGATFFRLFQTAGAGSMCGSRPRIRRSTRWPWGFWSG